VASPLRTPSGDGDQDPPERPQLQLSLAQVVASAAASVTAGVIASLFGVAGTIIGTVVVSVLATTGSAVYNLSIRRTQHRLRQARRQWREPTQPVQVPARPDRAGGSGERRLSAALAERGIEPARRDETASRRGLRRLRPADLGGADPGEAETSAASGRLRRSDLTGTGASAASGRLRRADLPETGPSAALGRLRRAGLTETGASAAPEPAGAAEDRGEGPWWRRGRAPALLGGVAALLVAVAVITGVELVGGRPVSAMVGGGGGSSGGTSFFGGSGSGSRHAGSKTKEPKTTTPTTLGGGVTPTTAPGAAVAPATTAPSTAVAPTTTTPPAPGTTVPPPASTTVPSGSSATTTPAGR